MSKPPNTGAWLRNKDIREGIVKAIYDKMKVDSSIYILGEGARMKVHYDAPMIEREFSDKVITLPISEDANTNFGVGMSLLGVKPVIDVITSDFLYRTMDAICNTAAKINYLSVNEPKTIVIRSEFMTAGPTTGQRIESLFTHIPGLNVVIPSNQKDAYGLMLTALSRPGVTIFFEDRMIADTDTLGSDKIDQDSIPPIPFGSAKVRINGEGLTIVSYGITLKQVEKMVVRNGYNAEVIDLRSLFPIDWPTIKKSVDRTHKLLIVEPDVVNAGIGAEIAATIQDICFDTLELPITRLGAPHTTIPSSPELLKLAQPSNTQLSTAIERATGAHIYHDLETGRKEHVE